MGVTHLGKRSATMAVASWMGLEVNSMPMAEEEEVELNLREFGDIELSGVLGEMLGEAPAGEGEIWRLATLVVDEVVARHPA